MSISNSEIRLAGVDCIPFVWRTPPVTGEVTREVAGGVTGQVTGQVAPQPESGPESQPESMEVRVLRLLASRPLGKAELSSGLGQKEIFGHLNKLIRLLLADQTIEMTLPDKGRAWLAAQTQENNK